MKPVTITQDDHSYVLVKEGGLYKVKYVETGVVVRQDTHLVRVVDSFFSGMIQVDGLDYPQLTAEFVPYPKPIPEQKRKWWQLL